MKKVVKAQITWVTQKNRGRKNPPTPGTRYCPIVVFDAMAKNRNEFWSADFICTEVDTKMRSIVDFAFLVEDAPTEFLVDGNKFELYEGNKKVAFGVILEELLKSCGGQQ